MSPGPCRDGLAVEGGLVLGRWHVADRAEEPVVVVPVDPAQRRVLEVVEPAPPPVGRQN